MRIKLKKGQVNLDLREGKKAIEAYLYTDEAGRELSVHKSFTTENGGHTSSFKWQVTEPLTGAYIAGADTRGAAIADAGTAILTAGKRISKDFDNLEVWNEYIESRLERIKSYYH